MAGNAVNINITTEKTRVINIGDMVRFRKSYA